MSQALQKLSLEEGLELDKLENIILKHQEGALLCWGAAQIIRDKRLYRAKYSNWNDYCNERWGWTQHRVNQRIRANMLKETLPEEVGTMVTNERTARALLAVPEGDRPAVIQAAAHDNNGEVNSTTVAAAAKKVKAKKAGVELDRTGYEIPRALVDLWRRREEVQSLLEELYQVGKKLEIAQQEDDPLWAEVNYTAVLADLKNAYTNIKASEPYSVCMQCQGHPDTQPDKQCRLCLGRGLIGEFRYKTVPEEARKMREKGAK